MIPFITPILFQNAFPSMCDLEAGFGNGNLGMNIGNAIWNWILGIGTRERTLEAGFGNGNLGMGFGNGFWN